MGITVDIQIARNLYRMRKDSGEDTAKRYLEDGKKNHPDLLDFDQYMIFLENYNALEKIFDFNYTPRKTFFGDNKNKLKILTEKLVAKNVQISGLPMELIISCDKLAFEKALGIDPLYTTVSGREEARELQIQQAKDAIDHR
ncbi:MAG: hypothetical protein KJ906_01140 [Nanoarchaeota archaeon]|nr:hypothetical protein [Nanoarchaeota archaeon]